MSWCSKQIVLFSLLLVDKNANKIENHVILCLAFVQIALILTYIKRKGN